MVILPAPPFDKIPQHRPGPRAVTDPNKTTVVVKWTASVRYLPRISEKMVPIRATACVRPTHRPRSPSHAASNMARRCPMRKKEPAGSSNHARCQEHPKSPRECVRQGCHGAANHSRGERAFLSRRLWTTPTQLTQLLVISRIIRVVAEQYPYQRQGYT